MAQGRLRFSVVVQPGARTTRIWGAHGDALKVQVQARATDGAANRAVLDLLAEAFAVPRSMLDLVAGASGRRKIFEVRTDDAERCRGRLRELMAPRQPVDNAGARA